MVFLLPCLDRRSHRHETHWHQGRSEMNDINALYENVTADDLSSRFSFSSYANLTSSGYSSAHSSSSISSRQLSWRSEMSCPTVNISTRCIGKTTAEQPYKHGQKKLANKIIEFVSKKLRTGDKQKFSHKQNKIKDEIICESENCLEQQQNSAIGKWFNTTCDKIIRRKTEFKKRFSYHPDFVTSNMRAVMNHNCTYNQCSSLALNMNNVLMEQETHPVLRSEQRLSINNLPYGSGTHVSNGVQPSFFFPEEPATCKRRKGYNMSEVKDAEDDDSDYIYMNDYWARPQPRQNSRIQPTSNYRLNAKRKSACVLSDFCFCKHPTEFNISHNTQMLSSKSMEDLLCDMEVKSYFYPDTSYYRSDPLKTLSIRSTLC